MVVVNATNDDKCFMRNGNCFLPKVMSHQKGHVFEPRVTVL